jgi:hypothetical protein
LLHLLRSWFAVFFAGLMGVSFLGTIAILAMQLLWWLKEGEWPSLTAGKASRVSWFLVLACVRHGAS